jgi:hypothetical protein
MNKRRIEPFLRATVSGGVVINDTIYPCSTIGRHAVERARHEAQG